MYPSTPMTSLNLSTNFFFLIKIIFYQSCNNVYLMHGARTRDYRTSGDECHFIATRTRVALYFGVSLHAREKREKDGSYARCVGRVFATRGNRPWIDKSAGWNEVARIALRVQRPCFHPRPSLAISLQSAHSHANYVISPFLSSFPFIFARSVVDFIGQANSRSAQFNQSPPSSRESSPVPRHRPYSS